MWKKPSPQAVETPNERPKAAVAPAAPASRPTARIGTSLVFKGDLQGDEDLVIEGKIEGKISIAKGRVTVGEKGRVEADIHALSIDVAGTVKGNLTGADRVVLHESGRVEGNIKAKSVVLENGCRFQGSIDMDSDVRERALTPAARVGA